MTQAAPGGTRRGGIAGVVFDLDGTLIDSAPDLMVTANKVLAAAGRRALGLAEVKGMIGDGIKMLVTRAFQATGAALTEDQLAAHVRHFLDIYTGEDAEPSHLYPGAVEALAALKARGVALGLCTNKSLAPTLAILRKLKLADFFAAISGGDSIPGIRKPDPRHLLAVVAELKVAPENAVMIGDKIHDVSCAHGAGLKAIAVSYGYANQPVAALGAEIVIDRLAEAPDAIARLS